MMGNQSNLFEYTAQPQHPTPSDKPAECETETQFGRHVTPDETAVNWRGLAFNSDSALAAQASTRTVWMINQQHPRRTSQTCHTSRQCLDIHVAVA